MKRVAITQPYVPEYRVALWEAVIDSLAEAGVEARVFWGGPRKAVEEYRRRGDLRDPAWATRVRTTAVPLTRRHPPMMLRHLPPAWRRPDLLLTEMQVTNGNAWVAALRRRPYVTFGHGKSGTTTDTWLANTLEGWLNRHARHVLTYDERGRAFVAEHARIAADRITSISNTTDTRTLQVALRAVTDHDSARFRSRHGIAPDAKVALYIGALEPYKRIDLLVEAARIVLREDPSWHLVVAGEGPERDRLERLRAESDRVTMLGRVPPSGYAPAALAARLIVNPGRVGLVAVDAMAMALPVVTTTTGPHAPEMEYLQLGRDVFTASPTPEAVARAWLAVADRPRPMQQRAVLSIDESARTLVGAILQCLA